jgi:broad specificity phosphatase PhoE
MARWGFVRHGESRANAERWLSGHIDTRLTERGQAQARAVRVDPSEWARIVTSDLSRARETAQLALPEVAFETVEAMRERTIGAWDGRAIEELKTAGHWETLLAWDGRPPEGESNLLLARRALTWLAEQPDVDTLVFAHGGLIRSVTGLVDGLPVDEIPLRKVANCEVQIRDVAPARWRALLEQLG